MAEIAQSVSGVLQIMASLSEAKTTTTENDMTDIIKQELIKSHERRKQRAEANQRGGLSVPEVSRKRII